MQLRQPSPDALVSFSDFLLERFGLIATMQVALVGSIAFHILVVIGLGFKLIPMPKFDAPHNVMDVVLVNARSTTKPEKADASRATVQSSACFALITGIPAVCATATVESSSGLATRSVWKFAMNRP